MIQQLLPLLVQESIGMDEGPQASKKSKIQKNRTKIPLLVRMVRTRDGLKVGILCIKHGNAKVVTRSFFWVHVPIFNCLLF